MRRLVIALFPLLCLGAECDEQVEDFPQRVVDRSARLVDDDGGWASSPWPGQIEDVEEDGLIQIEPTAGVELIHGLGRLPLAVQCYVGFSEDPIRVMPTAGNACEIYDASDTSILIKNGSGGSFFYRFVLR